MLACEICDQPKFDVRTERCLNCGGKLYEVPQFNIVGKQDNQVWNEAIEAAARCVHSEIDQEHIRRLKK